MQASSAKLHAGEKQVVEESSSAEFANDWIAESTVEGEDVRGVSSQSVSAARDNRENESSEDDDYADAPCKYRSE